MDPVTMVILLAMAGLGSAFLAFRRAGGASRAFRASDPASVALGLLVIAAAVGAAWVLVLGR